MFTMLRPFLVVSLLLAACAVRADGLSAVLVDAGVYDFQRTQSVPRPEGVSGAYTKVDGETLTAPTQTVPAKIGTHFGMRYFLQGQPEGTKIKVKEVLRYPGAGLTNPKTGQTQKEDASELSLPIKGVRATGYGFDHDWELRAGTWTMEVWVGDRLLLTQNFDVVLPPQ